MPTYQYACTACSEKLEAVQSFTDDALTECPSCSGALRKVYSAVGVVFKGSGFYKNDSRKATSESGQKKTDAVKSESGSKTDRSDSSSKSGDGATKTDTTSPKPAAAKSDSGASTASTPASKTA